MESFWKFTCSFPEEISDEVFDNWLQGGAKVNAADNFGYTPLHIAALNEFSHYVILLLAHGGDVTARTNGGASVLSFIVRRTPDVLPHLVQRFDAAVRLHDHEIGDVDCELKLDFRLLVPDAERGESVLLLSLIEVTYHNTHLYFKGCYGRMPE